MRQLTHFETEYCVFFHESLCNMINCTINGNNNSVLAETLFVNNSVCERRRHVVNETKTMPQFVV